MTWRPPRLVVKVALAMGPRDTPAGGDWTDLSDRVKYASGKRGRSDVLSSFGVGTVSVTLNNSDGMLDPLNPSGLVYIGDDLGLPLCPVEIGWDWAGDVYTVFTGFLGPRCWPGTGSRRDPVRTVELQAMDGAGYSPGLPSDSWGLYTQALAPDWWLRMDCGFPVLGDASVIPNRSGSGGSAAFTSPSGISRLTAEDSSTPPALLMAVGNSFTSAAADIMPDGDVLNLTVWLYWNASTPIGASDQAVVARMVEPGGGDTRWEVIVRDDGEAEVTAYDAGGTPIGSAIIDRTGSTISRFDDGNSHLLIVRFTSGNNMDVWFGGCGLTGGTLTATAAVYESDLIVGPAAVDATVDEVTLWRTALSDDQIAGAILATGGQAQPWHGDDWLDRLGHLYDACGKPVGVDETDEWHMPSPDPDDGLFGIGAVGNIPANLHQAADTVAQWAGGFAWWTRLGRLRARSLQALTDNTDPAYEAAYQTVTASFTDRDGTLDAGEYRHAGIEPEGADIDTVINRVEATFYRRADPAGAFGPPDVRPGSPFTITPQDDPSIDRYGIRNSDFTTEWWGWDANAAVADARLDRYKHPYAGINRVRLDATGDDRLTLWLASTCELELAVDVAHTVGGVERTFTGLNIQSIDWVLDTETLTVDLIVAKS